MCALYDNKMHAHYDKRHEVSSAWQHAYALGAREFPRAIQSQRSTQWKKYLSAHEPSRETGSDFSSNRLPTGLLVFDFHVAQSVSVNTTQDMYGWQNKIDAKGISGLSQYERIPRSFCFYFYPHHMILM